MASETLGIRCLLLLKKWQEAAGIISTGMNRGKPHMNSDSADPHGVSFVGIPFDYCPSPLERNNFPPFWGTLDLGTHDSSMDDVRSQVLMGTVRRLLADATGHDSRLPGLGMGRSSCNKDEEEGRVVL